MRDVPVNVAFTHFDGASDWNDVHSVCVGPEGGWEEGEWGEHPRLSLGPTVLRAETAGVVAASLSGLRRWWMGIYPHRRENSVMMRATHE